MSNNISETDGKLKGLYAGVRGTAIKLLNRIDRTDAYLDKLLEVELKNSELDGKDKALLYEIVHGVIRWLGRIDWILTGFYKGQFPKCIPNMKNAMRVALYQILFLDKVPDYAAVNEAVEFVKKLQGQKSGDVVNAVLRSIIRSKDGIRYASREEDLPLFFSAYYSHPSWLVKRWLNRYGEEFTEKLLEANNQKPTHTLRVNRLITSITEMEKLLQEVDMKYTNGKYLKNFLHLSVLSNITDWKYFKKGYFSIQDESTGIPVKLLEPQPGMKVLDLCAAPGGKTGMIAELMNNEGELVAIDRYESRLDILKKNLERLKIQNLRAVAIDALEFDEKDFDRVLVDAPCTGLGTLVKKPDIKWKRDIGDIRKLNPLQYDLLAKAATLVKVGGYVVYSTCTIEPEENIEIINKFLLEHPNFELVKNHLGLDESLFDENGCVQTYPHIHGIDGSFAAKLKRLR